VTLDHDENVGVDLTVELLVTLREESDIASFPFESWMALASSDPVGSV
jgi:hypothetical protein